MKKLSALFATLLVAFMLVGCAPKDYSAAKEKLEKAGYTVLGGVNDEVGENGEVATIATSKSLGSLVDGKVFGAVLYKTTKQAKEAYNKTKDAEGKTDYVLVGKWVVSSTDDEALKAFKK